MYLVRQFALLLFLLPLLSTRLLSQEDITVASVGDVDISLAEYEAMFLKTSTGKDAARQSTMEEREKFLDLLINFRLKLLDAYATGLDTHADVRDEMNLYKGSLATSYLIEREVTRPGVRKLFDERQTEYRASHILLAFDPADSTGSYARANEILDRLKKGEDFERLAVNASIDPSVKDNRGDLYYFTSGQMVRPFEDAVRGMSPGELLPYPVRTQYGLHLIKLVDKQPSSGEIRVSHIMTRFASPNPSPEDSLKAYQDLGAVLDSIRNGADFADMARKHSQDPGSSMNGGDLGWFARRRWVPEFDEQAFKLGEGQMSDIIRSRFGYHIILSTGRKPAKTFSEAESDMRTMYEQTRFQDDKARYLNALKQETGFHLNQEVLAQFIGELDTMRSLRYAGWADSLTPGLRRTPLITFGDDVVTVDSVVGMLKRRTDLNSTPLRPVPFRETIDKVAEQAVFQKRGETLEDDYPEFASLMKEYRDGILLYQVEQERVWNKISVSDSALHAFHSANRDKFTFPDRVRFVEIRAIDDSTAETIRSRSARGTTFAQIAAEDDARMARPSSYGVSFTPGSTRFSQESLDKMKAAAVDLKDDPRLRIHIIAHPDTGTGTPVTRRPENGTLAVHRTERMKKQLSFRLGIAEDRIATFIRPVRSISAGDDRTRQNDLVDLDVVGKRDGIIGSVDTLFVPLEEDERSRQAGPLQPGAISAPFRYKNGYDVILLLNKEPARPKTFEEAGTEVSSAYQEYESNRLQTEWLDRLRAKYPVVEHEEALAKAFAAAD